MQADNRMPPESNAEGGPVGMPLEEKRLTPWLAQRFADRARPLAPRPTIGTTALRLPHLDRQLDFGRSVDRLAGHVSGRAGPALSAQPIARSPIASRVSDFVLRKLTQVQAGWRQALSLPFVQRLRGSRSEARQAPGPAFSDHDHPAEKTVRGDTPVTEKSATPAAADQIISSAIDTEPVDTGHRLPHGEDATPESSQYAPIRSLPVTGGHMPVQQTTEDSDTSKSPRGRLRPGESGVIDQSDQRRGIVTRQVDTAHEAPKQIRRELQHPDLAHRVVRPLTSMTPQTALQRSLLQARPEMVGQRITGQQAPSIGYAHRQAGDQPEQRSRPDAPEEETAPFEDGLPAIQQARDSDVDSQRTPPDIAVPKRATRLLSRAFGDLQRSLIKPGSRESEITRPEGDTRPGMPSTQDAMISRSPASEAPPSPDFGAISYLHAPQPSVESSPTLPDQAVISRSMTGPETREVDAGISADSGSGPGYSTAQRNSPPGHVPSVARSMIRSTPMIPSHQRAAGMAFRRLFRALPDTPGSIETEDREFPQSPGYEPSSPSYEYARQPAPTLPLVSGAPWAGFTAADSAELFRYASDVSPQIDHSGNHNGLDLPPATVNRAVDTGPEPQTAATELPKEKSEDKQAAPDIRALAREVYPLIKRMIMIERDRHPTWY